MSNFMRSKSRLAPRTISKKEFLTPFDRLFDDMLEDMFPHIYKDLGDNFFVKGSYPKVNVINKENFVMIEAAIPGMQKEEVTVEVLDGVLTICGNSNQSENISDSQYIKREIKRSSFRRSFRLNDTLSKEDIFASYDNGILTLNIKKNVPGNVDSEARIINIS